jgi:hypothetical protein
MGLLDATAANAQAVILECTIGGEEGTTSFSVNKITKTKNTGTAMLPAQMSPQTITWHEDEVLRMIDRKTGAVLHRLPDGSHFQIGECLR